MVIQFHPLTERLTQDRATVFLYPQKQKRDSREGVRGVSKIEKEGAQRYLGARLGVILLPVFVVVFVFELGCAL